MTSESQSTSTLTEVYTKSDADSLILSSQETGDSSLLFQAIKIYESIGETESARNALKNSMQNSEDPLFLSQCNSLLKSYSLNLQGKEEFEEFTRIIKNYRLKEGSLWHAVSKTWIKEWEEFNLYEGPHPGPINNEEIIEKNLQFIDKREGKDYQNVLIKREALEKVDFEVIPKIAYNFLQKKYGNNSENEIKRWCVSLNDDGSGLHIEIHLKPLKVLIVPSPKLQIFPMHLSRIETISSLKEKILASFEEFKSFEVRFWKTQENLNLKNLANSQKFTVRGKVIKENASIEDCEIAENDLIIAEFKTNKTWILFHPDEICAFCKNSGTLSNCSICKSVKYCSKNCQIADYPSHKMTCKKIKTNIVENEGLVGLQNLGNTCFLNSALQCVLHTIVLRDYFITSKYLGDINKSNPLGTKDAALAQVFGKIVEEMWLGKNEIISPWALKKVISKFAPQFVGYEQHDSHELLTYLLTGLHEDLNRIKVKPYIEKPDCDHLSDFEASQISWKWFLERNKSFFVDNMYGQIKSTLKCPLCSKTSITFDPFLTFSINIPSTQKQSHSILLVFINNKIVNQELELLSGSSILKLKQILMNKYKIQNIAICFYNKLSIQGICEDYNDISDYSSKNLIGFECAPNFKELNPVPIKYYLYKNNEKNLVTFTRLLFLDSSYTLKKIHKFLKNRLDKNFEVNVINTAGYTGVFNKTRLPCDFCGLRECQNCALPKSNQTLEEIKEKMKNSEGLLMLEIILQSGHPFLKICNEVEDSQIYSETSFFDTKLNLKNCLEYSTRPEILDIENEWYCSSCKKNVQALKTLQLYKSGKILIFHLIRFKNRGMHSAKINELIDFPIHGLEMKQVSDEGVQIYDLYAVCNHFGGLGGGHYTAFVKINTKWFHMDDEKVKEVDENSVISPAAYILFYQVRE